MRAYVLGRLASAVPVLFGVSVVVFLLMKLIPGDAAQVLAGPSATREEVELIREDLGLNEPLYVQYGKWLARAVRGDLGRSIELRAPVTVMVLERFKNTAILAGASMLLAVAIGVSAGVISATRPLSLFDRLAMVGALFGNSMPTFWLGLVLILVFSLGLGLFPSNGMYDIRSGGGPVDLLHHLVLPSITLAGVSAAILARVTRSSMLEVIHREYVTTARAKGLGDRRVIWGHALKNAMLPVVTVMGVQLGYLLGGSILVETVFSWPGLGLQLFRAISSRDLPLVQGGVMLVSAIFVFLNLAIDVLYAFLDPRVRYS
ncbi:MAG TPA: ABC transporter permease [Chloroflexota bacterium]|nr:ABC transporter permease [Chloroflexota bacterium]